MISSAIPADRWNSSAARLRQPAYNLRAAAPRPAVSIVTPVFNAAPWLGQTLASVRAQSFTCWEHLLVDDGSTDGSAAILEAAAAADARIRILRMPRTAGPSAARNFALDAAQGRFVAFLDADDLWLPDKLSRCVAWMTGCGYAFVYHDYRHMLHDGSRAGRLIAGPDELNYRTLHTHRGTGCLSVVIDREQVSGLRFPAGSAALNEDFRAWLGIVKAGHVGHRLAYDLGRYRLSNGSRSANKLASALEVWRIYRTESGLPFHRALGWWLQYACNALRLHRRARPGSKTGEYCAACEPARIFPEHARLGTISGFARSFRSAYSAGESSPSAGSSRNE